MPTLKEILEKAKTADFGKEEKIGIYLSAFQNALVEAYFEGADMSPFESRKEHLNKFLDRI